MSQRDIAEQIKNLYDVEISPELVSKISEKIMSEVQHGRTELLKVLSVCVYGCYSLQGKVGSSVYHKSSICSFRYQS